MDTARPIDDPRHAPDADASAAGRTDGRDPAAGVGTDERRMHVRAYNHWVSLLNGRAYPSIDDLNPAGIADFGAHSVLLDFSDGIENPTIRFLGRSLREECGLDPSVTRIADVPARSLLSRLTDHYLQIIANRAPIGFEAEFLGTRGHTMLYRGILMPFSSDEDAINYIYGVINWKEMLDAPGQAGLAAELDAAAQAHGEVAAALPSGEVAVWADGPGAGTPPGVPSPPAAPEEDTPADDLAPFADGLSDRLTAARALAAAVTIADTRSRRALYHALARAHDFALAAAAEPGEYALLLAEAGITGQARAPMTPLVKLVFGVGQDKTRLTEFATVLSAAREAGIAEGGLIAFLDAHPGGIKGVVQAARAARRANRPAARPTRAPKGFAGRPALASVVLANEAEPGAPVLLVARAAIDGAMEIVGTVADAALIRRAVAAIG